MTRTLAQLETRISQVLVDTANANYTTGLIDEALRHALGEYSQHYPLIAQALLTLPGAGRTIALNTLTDLLDVTAVWWPYSLTDNDDTNESNNQVKGFKLWRDDTFPVVTLQTTDDDQPKLNDPLLIWYTKPHTVQNLDSASTTTFVEPHESKIVRGAAGYAAASRAVDRTDEFNLDPKLPVNMLFWGQKRIEEYQAWLFNLKAQPGLSSPSTFPQQGWKLDKWDDFNP